MFRSRLTLEQYLSSVQTDTTSDDPSLDNINDITFQEDEKDVFDEDDDNVRIPPDLDPSLLTIPSDFNDRQEVLVIDGEGNISRDKGKITTSTVYALDYPKRILVPLNQYLQPVKKAGNLFNRFLADVSRRPNLCPLDYKEWRLVPDYYKERIKVYIRRKFLLPPGVDVNKKIVQAVVDKLRGYKSSLRCKYRKNEVTKEELYQLEDRPPGVSDQMWVGFIDHIYSEKFKKFSDNGKYARSKQLHSHTQGSQSFAIARDIFVKENDREPGAIEWFVKTHQRKDKTYNDQLTGKFVDSAISIVKQKTGSADDVVFSESTKEAEAIAYHKLLGHEKKGRIRGYGYGVMASEVNNLSRELGGKRISMSDSSLVSYLVSEIKKVTDHARFLEGRVNDLQCALTSSKPSDLPGEETNDNDVPITDNSHLETSTSDKDINASFASQQVEKLLNETSPHVMIEAQRSIIDQKKLPTQNKRVPHEEKLKSKQNVLQSADFRTFSQQQERMDEPLGTIGCERLKLKDQVKNQLGSCVKTHLVINTKKAYGIKGKENQTTELTMKENKNVSHGIEKCIDKRIRLSKDEFEKMGASSVSNVTLLPKQLFSNNTRVPFAPMTDKETHQQVNQDEEKLKEIARVMKNGPNDRTMSPLLLQRLEMMGKEHKQRLAEQQKLAKQGAQGNPEVLQQSHFVKHHPTTGDLSSIKQGTHCQSTDLHKKQKATVLGSSPKIIGRKRQLVSTTIIESIVDKVMEENMVCVQKYRRGTKKELAQCFLAGMATSDARRRGIDDPMLVDEILRKKLEIDNTDK